MCIRDRTFAVKDAKTGEDLTRSILLQIILEEESAGAPMFTESVLANIIRFYGHAMQGHMGAYLESNLQSLMLMQSKMGHQSQNIVAQMQEQMQKQTAQFLSAFGLKP
jgi:polyhydroxyalkanoate synthesis repressor PhaR